MPRKGHVLALMLAVAGVPETSQVDPNHVVFVDGERVVGVLSMIWTLGHREQVACSRAVDDIKQRDHVAGAADATILEALATNSERAPGVAAVLPLLSGA